MLLEVPVFFKLPLLVSFPLTGALLMFVWEKSKEDINLCFNLTYNSLVSCTALNQTCHTIYFLVCKLCNPTVLGFPRLPIFLTSTCVPARRDIPSKEQMIMKRIQNA